MSFTSENPQPTTDPGAPETAPPTGFSVKVGAADELQQHKNPNNATSGVQFFLIRPFLYRLRGSFTLGLCSSALPNLV